MFFKKHKLVFLGALFLASVASANDLADDSDSDLGSDKEVTEKTAEPSVPAPQFEKEAPEKQSSTEIKALAESETIPFLGINKSDRSGPLIYLRPFHRD